MSLQLKQGGSSAPKRHFVTPFYKALLIYWVVHTTVLAPQQGHCHMRATQSCLPPGATPAKALAPVCNGTHDLCHEPLIGSRSLATQHCRLVVGVEVLEGWEQGLVDAPGFNALLHEPEELLLGLHMCKAGWRGLCRSCKEWDQAAVSRSCEGMSILTGMQRISACLQLLLSRNQIYSWHVSGSFSPLSEGAAAAPSLAPSAGARGPAKQQGPASAVNQSRQSLPRAAAMVCKGEG